MQIDTLPAHLVPQAAALYWDAFSDKLGKLLAPEETAIAFFADILQPQHAIAAISDDGSTLLGVAGFDIGEGGIVGGGMKDVIAHYGLLSGLWRGILLEFLTRKTQADSLQMDGITTRADARGQGIGSALLEAIFETAQAAGKEYVYLDVIDKNLRAKALYERMGFETVKTERLGPLKHIFGFEASYKMRKRLNA